MSESVHLESVVYVLRAYSGGRTHENRDPYDGVLTLQIFDDVAFIQGMHGEISRRHYKMMLEGLKERGVSTIYSDRHGKKREYKIEDYLKRL